MKRLVILSALFFWLTTACKSGSDERSLGYESTQNDLAASYEPSAPPQANISVQKLKEEEQSTSGNFNYAADKKIIKTAGIRMQVKTLEESRKKIDELISKYQAYIASENTANTGHNLENNIVIRVNYAKFDALVEDIVKEAAYLNFKNINAQDVTEEFVDVEARLKTKKQVEARYRELLAKARTVEDILKIENELRVIREEIESREGRLKYLKNQVQYSTINLDMYQELAYRPSPKFGFFSRILEAFRRGWDGFLSFFVGLVYIWPFVILLIIIIFIVRKRLRMRRLFRAKNNENENKS